MYVVLDFLPQMPLLVLIQSYHFTRLDRCFYLLQLEPNLRRSGGLDSFASPEFDVSGAADDEVLRNTDPLHWYLQRKSWAHAGFICQSFCQSTLFFSSQYLFFGRRLI
jgi:hypothetical protein